MHRTALIAGDTCKDSAYLAHHLLGLCYRVEGIATEFELESLAPNDFCSVLKVVSGVKLQEIFNLARQTRVGVSFE